LAFNSDTRKLLQPVAVSGIGDATSLKSLLWRQLAKVRLTDVANRR